MRHGSQVQHRFARYHDRIYIKRSDHFRQGRIDISEHDILPFLNAILDAVSIAGSDVSAFQVVAARAEGLLNLGRDGEDDEGD